MLVVAAGTTILACGSSNQVCSDGLNSYNDHCLPQNEIEFLECIRPNVDTYEKMSGNLGGSFKDLVGATLGFDREETITRKAAEGLLIDQKCAEGFAAKPDQPQIDRAAAESVASQANILVQQYNRTAASKVTAPTTSSVPSSGDSGSPLIALTPPTGTAGEDVQVSGASYDSGETIDIDFDGALVGQPVAGLDGSFATSFKVPDSASADSSATIRATGESSGKMAESQFSVRSSGSGSLTSAESTPESTS